MHFWLVLILSHSRSFYSIWSALTNTHSLCNGVNSPNMLWLQNSMHFKWNRLNQHKYSLMSQFFFSRAILLLSVSIHFRLFLSIVEWWFFHAKHFSDDDFGDGKMLHLIVVRAHSICFQQFINVEIHSIIIFIVSTRGWKNRFAVVWNL